MNDSAEARALARWENEGGRVIQRSGASGVRSILVPLDLTPGSDRVLARVGLLPTSSDARVTLLHVVPGDLSPRQQRSVERDARKALAEEVRHLRPEVGKRVKIAVRVEVGTPAEKIATTAADVGAELVVMGRGGGRALREAFLGSTAERVIRRTQLPVLVVRLPARAAYRRPALALDLDHPARDMVTLMLRLLSVRPSHVDVIHAYDAPYHGMIYPSLTPEEAEERDHTLRLAAIRDLTKVLAKATADLLPPDRPAWKTHVKHGSPRMVVEGAVKRAETDLLVLGTRGRQGAAYALLGTVAGELLRATSCDVLTVPPAPRAAGKRRGQD